jgi:DNA-binding protein HU-beta
MNKRELVDALANGAGVTKADASRVLQTFITTITDVLKRGDQVVLPGFGSFKIKDRAARNGINPLTRQPLSIPASKHPHFSAGKTLKEAVQEK